MNPTPNRPDPALARPDRSLERRRGRRRTRVGGPPSATSRTLARARLLVQNGIFLLGAAVLIVVVSALIGAVFGGP